MSGDDSGLTKEAINQLLSLMAGASGIKLYNQFVYGSACNPCNQYISSYLLSSCEICNEELLKDMRIISLLKVIQL